MSDILKCPYCGGILEQSSIFNLNSYACTDLACKGYFMTATKDMWQELIRTRKALETAVKSIKLDKEFGEYMRTELGRAHKALEIAIQYIKHTQSVEPFWFNSLANETLDKIETALEQKDVK